MRRRPRGPDTPGPEEEHGPAVVEDNEPGQDLAVLGGDRERRVWSYRIRDLPGDTRDVRRSVWPHQLDEFQERFADCAGQAAGQRTSLTTATRIPATAPAMPFFAASFWRMREMKLEDEAVGVDMRMSS